MTDNERTLYVEAIELWGAEAQVNMLHEEIGELLVAMNKLWREPKNGINRSEWLRSTLEEIEDVRIMLDQMVVLLNSTDGVQGATRDLKNARLRERLAKERADREKRDAWKTALMGARR